MAFLDDLRPVLFFLELLFLAPLRPDFFAALFFLPPFFAAAMCSLSIKELNYSASPPVELPTDAASEQARVVASQCNIVRNAAATTREYRNNGNCTQQVFHRCAK